MRKFSLLHLSYTGGKLMFVSGVLLIALLSTAACTVSLPQAPKPLAACTVTAANLNLRGGPGVDYPRITKMPQGTRFAVRAQNGTGNWFVGSWNETTGWASAAYLDCPANAENVPVLTMWPEPPVVAPPQPSQLTEPPVAAARAPVQPQAPAAVITMAGVNLVGPLNAELGGQQVFRWAPVGELQPGQAFELVFWRPGQDPLVDGFSPIGARPAPEVRVDLDATSSSLPQLNFGTDYQWGVLLVEMDPYRRLSYLGGGQFFRLTELSPSNVADSSSDGGDSGPVNEEIPDDGGDGSGPPPFGPDPDNPRPPAPPPGTP